MNKGKDLPVMLLRCWKDVKKRNARKISNCFSCSMSIHQSSKV